MQFHFGAVLCCFGVFMFYFLVVKMSIMRKYS